MGNQINDSIQISFGMLSVLGDEPERQPLSFLNDNCHVHGELKIVIGARSVPYMGFFGPDDVCFSTWIDELDAVEKTFRNAEIASYLFDECEQGQPAYLFEKEGEKGFLSIVDSPITKAQGDSEWQRIEFNINDFLTNYDRFRSDFINELKTAAPEQYQTWLSIFISHC